MIGLAWAASGAVTVACLVAALGIRTILNAIDLEQEGRK